MEDDDFMIDEDFDTELSFRDLRRLKDVHCKAGYRDGLNDGQESTLQNGFNRGFSDAAIRYKMSSKLRGSLSAMILFFDSKNEKLCQDLKMFLSDIKALEDMETEIDHCTNNRTRKKDQSNCRSECELDSTNLVDVEMMIDNISLSNDKSPVQVNESHNVSTHNCCCGNPASVNANSHIQTDILKTCKCSSATTIMQEDRESRTKLKYAFDIEEKFEELEVILRRHQISSRLIEKLREYSL
ncbi:protein YAE1 homolog [Rhopilema esculentum]|uniref:protein YAE1 homolog n=1 Tax=Rhopilema esculentum TaxID=499914 RepID=UPI0031CFB1AF|eukprot:gene14621-5703_t